MRRHLPVAISVLAFAAWAASWVSASPGSAGESSIGVATGRAIEAPSGKGRVRFDNYGSHRGAKASWKIISQWKWPENPPVGVLTYCIKNGTADIAGTGENTAIKEALTLWEEQAARLAFSESCKSPKVIFKWEVGDHGDGDPFDGEGGVLAHADPPEGGEVCFDDAETWTLEERANNKQPIDLLTVAAHEIGHILGLDHSTDTGAIMVVNYTQSHRFLNKDDLEGLKELFKSLID